MPEGCTAILSSRLRGVHSKLIRYYSLRFLKGYRFFSLTGRRYGMLSYSIHRRYRKHIATGGVSGIDGSTSTAIGSSCVDNGTTLLVTGDMSFAYDAGGLATGYATPRFKVVVLCNEGGGIFRFIKGRLTYPSWKSASR